MTKTLVTLAAACVAATAMSAQGSSALKGVPGTPSLAPATSDTFTFFVAGHNRPVDAATPQPATPGQIFSAAKAQRAAFVVWTGDMIYGLDDEDTSSLATQYSAFFALARAAGVPVFAAPGNHEMNIKVKSKKGVKTEIGSAKMEAAYRQNFGLAAGGQIYGSFTYANSHFVVLNSSEVAPKAAKRAPFAKPAPDVNLDPGHIPPAQLDWLRADLAANTSLHTFVFMHHPIKPKKKDMALDPKDAAELVAEFSKHKNISYVFASHEHLYYNPQTKDLSPLAARTDPTTGAPLYVVSGGAGAKLVGTPETGGFHHYLKITVQGNRVQPEIVKLP